MQDFSLDIFRHSRHSAARICKALFKHTLPKNPLCSGQILTRTGIDLDLLSLLYKQRDHNLRARLNNRRLC